MDGPQAGPLLAELLQWHGTLLMLRIVSIVTSRLLIQRVLRQQLRCYAHRPKLVAACPKEIAV
jgi:hypothetical protein